MLKIILYIFIFIQLKAIFKMMQECIDEKTRRRELYKESLRKKDQPVKWTDPKYDKIGEIPIYHHMKPK